MIKILSRRILVPALLVASAGVQAGFQEGLDAYKSGNYIYALDEFKPLAIEGDPAAQYRLGVMYAQGQGVPKDYKQAVSWYLKAAVKDDARAQFALAEMYSQGSGVLQDDKMAAKWYLESAGHGYPKAQHTIGLMYAKGLNVPQDLVQAHKWLSIAGEIAAKNKDWLEEKMTPEQIKKAQSLANEWLAQH